MFKGVGCTVYLKAWDNDNQAWKTGYQASITPRGCGDGTMFTPAGSLSEVSATYYPGLYKITFTDAENDYNVNAVGGSAVASTITIHGMEWINTPVDFHTTQKASINTEADTALSDIKLDHLVAVAESGDVVNSSIIAKLASKSATPAWSSYNNTTDSLEGIKDDTGASLTAIPTIATVTTVTNAVTTTSDTQIDNIEADTNELQGLISSSKIAAQVKGMDADTLTASALKTDAVTEITDAIKNITIDGAITLLKALKLRLAKDIGTVVVDGNTIKYYDQSGALLLSDPITLSGSTRVVV